MQTIKLDLKGRPYKKKKYYTYYGYNIDYSGGPGYSLSYHAYFDGYFHCSDTLAGIKKMILEYVKNDNQ